MITKKKPKITVYALNGASVSSISYKNAEQTSSLDSKKESECNNSIDQERTLIDENINIYVSTESIFQN